MTKKKPKTAVQSAEQQAVSSDAASPRVPPPLANTMVTTTTTAAADPISGTKSSRELTVPSMLVICRNKHWRHISSYHGPWLSLPPEVLESLSFSNYYSPRPRPIDPAVFFDLVKIRRLLEDATSLAVRAANGTTSASLHTSMNAANGMLNGADAEILGIGMGRASGTAKLSRERKYRMREHATQKMSAAYHLDEIATSVATMQSASALEEVAHHVLQRNHVDPDAQYVHFFHEKIPSMAMAQHTSLQPLDDIVRQRPTEAPPYRTRAVARVFKDDFEGAARDCTDGLTVHRLYHPPHQDTPLDLAPRLDVEPLGRDHQNMPRVLEKDQPSSLEPQLLFHRGGAYLTLACKHVPPALSGASRAASPSHDQNPCVDAVGDDARKTQADARKMVRTYAKRALRDFMAFLSHLDYCPGPCPIPSTQALGGSPDALEACPRADTLLGPDGSIQGDLTEVAVKHAGKPPPLPPPPPPASSSPNPQSVVYKLNSLFTAVTPPGLPPYPPPPGAHANGHGAVATPADVSECVTYHPLLTDVLHSLLICHCLIQTSNKELQRHAYMVARVARVCDGYPIFLAARSPSRADWIDIIRQSHNWLRLSASWESLCAPAPLSGQTVTGEAPNATRGAKEVRAPIQPARPRDVSADGRLVDKEFLTGHAASSQLPKRWAQEDGKEYPVTPERAASVVRWIMEAPSSAPVDGIRRPKKKSAVKGKPRPPPHAVVGLREADLEHSVESLDLTD